ncbi:ATP-binding protein [Pedobacter vanadiisoli]|uniref:ATP-binding protein n=1 Tax=Pedobacter vanadiisoli TaxID=1761975 RepID=A0ABW5MH00_9SPHI
MPGTKEELSFSIKTGLKNIIGKDLITDEYIAVFELVKNSYDAQAQNVTIVFEDNRIIIADDGKGMSKNDLEHKWFAVAYSAKKDGTEDDEEEIENEDDKWNENDESRESYRDKIKVKRFYAGAKGIGRFSCDRLGKNLILKTRARDANIISQVDINWLKFEKDAKLDFNKVKVPYESYPAAGSGVNFPNNAQNGTILEISGLSFPWEREKIKSLKHSLEKLINPFSETNVFTITIACEKYREIDESGFDEKKKPILDRDKINGPVKNSILDILNLKTTQIDIDFKDITIETKLIDRGTQVYRIKEPNHYAPLLNNLKINLYFLNRTAKVNFTRLMGIEPINYGSVFLFKNGFRVQPYGNTGDDSWGLDFRAQQGYNRFLSSRELFGRVDIITEEFEQFKEVSSRDGGLVETFGSAQLLEAFKEIGLKRLERYVVGVLWGEAFIRKKYFNTDSEGKKLRDNLLATDKDSEDYSKAKANLGSKIDFIQLMKSLADNKEIEIVEYDKNLVDLVNDNLEEVQPKFIKDLEKIAESTGDDDLKEKIFLTEQNYRNLLAEKEAAEKRAQEEETKRKAAEETARREEERRRRAEEKARREEEKRREAELATERKEKERYKAQVERLLAEQKAKEEKEKREREEEKNKDLNEKLSLEKQKNTYLSATRKTLSGEDAEQLVHSIDLYVGNASTHFEALFNRIDSFDLKTKEDLYFIKSNLDRALKVSQIIIKSNFDYKSAKHKVDLSKYIEEYVKDSALSRKDKLSVEISNSASHNALISTIDIDIIIDNLVSNSVKAGATKISIDLSKNDDKLVMDYYDNGRGLPDIFLRNQDEIYNLGTRESQEKGSGIGMYDIYTRITALKGSISILGNNLKLKGAGFQLTFK